MTRIFLVDDEPLVLIGMQGMLNWSELGYEVAGTARNGAEALKAIEEKHPDIVVSDIRMPVMNGIQATEKIRTIDIDLPIVAVTANAFLIEQQQALAAGCNDIIAKPYTYERLKETIIKYI